MWKYAVSLKREIHTYMGRQFARTGRSTRYKQRGDLQKAGKNGMTVTISLKTLSAYTNLSSLLNTFAKKKFGDYWFETGTPSYLVELLKHTHYDLYEMANTETDADVLKALTPHPGTPYLSFTRADT